MKPSVFDSSKLLATVLMRHLNQVAIERWSKSTFRRRRALTSGPLELEPAGAHYGSPAIPKPLRVPRVIPPEGRLGLGYVLPYYYLVGLFFKLYRRWPIREDLAWSPSARWNSAFPRNEEGWEDLNTDAGFARLRLQGPNPFLLRKTAEEGGYEVDYSPYFKGIHPPVVCRFRLDGRKLEPVSIHIGRDFGCRPGDASWERAKLVANALDARYCIFVRHLLNTHLLIAEAYAASAYSLPPRHRLRPFLDFFTYGSLVVNDFAYKLLITPASYFLQSHFISGEDALTLMRNGMAAFSLDDLLVRQDVEKRGINQIPAHPYVEDACEAWDVLHRFVDEYVGGLYADDAAVARDEALQGWSKALSSLLPNRDITDAPLTSRARLVNVLSCLLYNNVSHEVCGDFSQFAQSLNPEHKKLINFERLKAGDFDSETSLADIFLYDQGAYAGRFNNGGNNMLATAVDRYIEDPTLRRAVAGMQGELRALDRRLEERNKHREAPFYRMMPRRWEFSVSF